MYIYIYIYIYTHTYDSIITIAKMFYTEITSYIGVMLIKNERKQDCIHVDHNQLDPFTISNIPILFWF